MKTAKKLLALVLVIVMAVGLVSFASAKDAATYTDIDDVDPAALEALYVMSAIGVTQGYPEGNFEPKGSFTRAEASKIIAWMLVGEKADLLPNADAQFKDTVGHWASKYIAYCVTQGILVGYGDGNFGPNDTVTNAQFCIMLLRALGFGLKGEYTGEAWAMNAYLDAVNKGIFSLDEDFTADATREQVVVFAYNALFYGVTTTKTDVFKIVAGTGAIENLDGAKYSTFLEAYTTGVAVGADYVASSPGQDKFTINKDVEIVTKGGLAGDVFGMTQATSSDDFMRPTSVYYNKDNKPICVFRVLPLQEYTAGVSGAKIYSDLGLASAPASNPQDTYVDGLIATPTSLASSAVAPIATTGNGVDTTVYRLADGSYRIVSINTYLAKVTAVAAATATADRNITLDVYDGATTITIAGYETDDFAAGDFVLLTKFDDDPDAIDSIKPAAMLENTAVTRYSSTTSVTFGGAVYNYSKKAGFGINTNYSFTATYDFFLDDYGYIIGNKVFSAGVEALSFIYIKDAKVTEYTAGGVFGTSIDARVQVEGYYMDGTRVVADVKIPLVAGVPTIKLDGVTYDLTNTGDVSALKTALIGQVYSYTLDEKLLVLSDIRATTGVPTTSAGIVGAGFGIQTGKTNVGGIAGAFANSATVVVNVDLDPVPAKVTKATGVASFPNYSPLAYDAVYVKTGSTITNILIITDNEAMTGPAAPAATSYAVYNGVSQVTSDGTEYQLFVNGVLDWYVLAEGVAAPNGVTIYAFAQDSEGLVTLSAGIAMSGAKKITALNDSFYVYLVGTTETASDLFAAGYKVYDVSGLAFGEGTLAKDKWVVSINDGFGQIAFVYIVPEP